MRRLGLLALLALLLSGCAGVPTTGPVHQGAPSGNPGEDQFIRVIARPPHDGMSPEELVRGFLEASASANDGYAIARQYLTPGAAAAWRPQDGVKVYDNSRFQLAAGPQSVVATGVLEGTLDGSGEYAVAARATPLAVTYSIGDVGGQPRIASLPDGLVLGRADLERGFRTLDLYFPDPSFSVLVPAPVTVPVTGSGLATTLVSGLLAGPSTWVAPAVRTAFPEGTRLALGSVPVDGGVAQVELTNEVLATDDTTRQVLSAQLAWTLRQLPDVTAVRITVGGQPLSVPGVGPVQPVDSWPTYNPDVLPVPTVGYAVSAGRVVQLTPTGAQPVGGSFGRGAPPLALPAVSLDGRTLAALTADRRAVYTSSQDSTAAPKRVATGTDLSAPSFDRTGALWLSDVGVGVELVRDGTPQRVPLTDLPKGTTEADVQQVSVSRDGARAVLLLRRGSHVEPWVARVERTGTTVRLAAPRRVETAVVYVEDVAWADSDTLVLLGSDGASALQVTTVGLGFGRSVSVTAPTGSVRIAAAPGVATLVATPNKIYEAALGAAWEAAVDGYDPSYPG